jgi:membrane protein
MATWVELIKETFDQWQADEAPRLGASLAYYAIFSMAPLLVIVVAIIGFVYKGDTVGEIQHQMESRWGPLPQKWSQKRSIM